MSNRIEPLLSPDEVSKLLRVSIKTVYENGVKLGGFYPAGIRCLRFRREIIERIMEGKDYSSEKIDQPKMKRQSTKKIQHSADNEPASDPNRHGLFGKKC